MGINSEKTSQIFFFFFLRFIGVREDHTSSHYPFVHAGAPADYLYDEQSHTRVRARARARTHTPVMDFLETRRPKKAEEEEEEEVYREKRLFRYFFSWFSANVNTTDVCQYTRRLRVAPTSIYK